MGEVVGWDEREPKAWCDVLWIQGRGHPELFKNKTTYKMGVLTYSLGNREVTNA